MSHQRFFIVPCLCLPLIAVFAQAGESVPLVERFTEGVQYRVQTRVELSGTLTPPPAKGKTAQLVKIEGSSSIDYDERILTLSKGHVNKSIRQYRKLDFRRTLAGQKQELALRSSVRRLVILRQGHTEVPFSPDGPLVWGEIDAVRTDVFVPALAGLFPNKPVAPGDRWLVSERTVEELTDLEKIEQGTLECKLDRFVEIGGKKRARITFTGTIIGISEDGPAKHRLQGTYHFDLSDGFMSDLTLLGSTFLLDKDGKEAGKIEGRFVLSREKSETRELSDASLKSLTLEPNPINTQLLYANPEMGIRFLHSRRWRIAQVMGSQIGLATRDGSGLLITLDPLERVPTADSYQKEAKNWLTQQKAKLLRVYTPRRLREQPTLDGFAFEAEMAGQKVWLDYYVTVQKQGGVTVAARLLLDDLKELRREVDRIAKSVEVTNRVVDRKK